MTARNARSNRAERQPGADDWVAIGEIVGTFGVRGEVKVEPLTDFPERFGRTETVYLGDGRVPRRVEGAHPHKRLILVKLEGVADRTAAERLRGARLYVPLAEITPLAADQFYIHDVVGARVQHVDGRYLGTVADVLSAAGNDLFVVRDAPQGGEVLLPAVREFVKSVDPASRLIVVDPIPGLFDDQAAEAREDETDDEAESGPGE